MLESIWNVIIKIFEQKKMVLLKKKVELSTRIKLKTTFQSLIHKSRLREKQELDSN